jgi:hypothetical protein
VKQWFTSWPYALQWGQGWLGLGLEVVTWEGLRQSFFQCGPLHLQHLSLPTALEEISLKYSSNILQKIFEKSSKIMIIFFIVL